MYENKISARQLRRMIFIETFGAGALSIPESFEQLQNLLTNDVSHQDRNK